MKHACVIAVAALAGSNALANAPAFEFEGGRALIAGTGAINLVRGWEFTVDELDILVTGLGHFDAGNDRASNPPDGLLLPKDMAIYDSNGDIVVQATVPAGTAGTLVDNWRYATFDAVTLSAGQSYTVVSFATEGELVDGTYDAVPLLDNNWFFPDAFRRPVIEFENGITFVQSRFELFVPGLEFPTRTSDNIARLGTANFLFAQVPTPGAATLFAISALAATKRRRSF